MLGLWRVAPEVERGIRVLDAGLWVALLGVDEVWELNGVSNEEDWRVVTDHVVVSFLGIELDCESSRVSVAIVGTTFTGDRREANEDWSLLTNLVKECSLGEPIKSKN
jgi:hypothetical protein